jgi:hypothetical protein
MKRLVITIVGGLASLHAARVASAAPPAWCKGAPGDSPDLRKLSSQDAGEVIKTFVAAECSPTAEIEDRRAEVEAARQAWSKRLGMTEADWADAVAYAGVQDYSIRAELSAKTLAAATPIDQYAVIAKASESVQGMGELYAADMFEPNLSETGRLGFLQVACFHHGQAAPVDANGMTGTEVIWAICQTDLERIDVATLLGEIRADTAHDGALKMKLRLAAYELPRRVKDHAAEVDQMMHRDDANRKLFEVARAAHGEWASGVGKNTKLLELVLAMDSAAVTQSRKQLEGCGETTAAALADAVAAIPARAFDGMRDKHDDQSAGFASQAGPVLAQSPAVTLAAIAFLRCTPEGGVSEFLAQIADSGIPSRGPRNAALGKIRNTRITYDKVGAKLVYPRARPYGGNYLETTVQFQSAGGTIKTVKRVGDTVTVQVQQTTMSQTECVRGHHTGRVSRIRGDGRVEYEEVCDRSEKRTHDNTWKPFELSAKYAAWLKPGAVFSATGKDVIAMWPNAGAKLPSMVLGGAVK